MRKNSRKLSGNPEEIIETFSGGKFLKLQQNFLKKYLTKKAKIA